MTQDFKNRSDHAYVDVANYWSHLAGVSRPTKAAGAHPLKKESIKLTALSSKLNQGRVSFASSVLFEWTNAQDFLSVHFPMTYFEICPQSIGQYRSDARHISFDDQIEYAGRAK